MADRIAVMENGVVVQVDAPERLYESPDSPFVARFLGESNLFSGALRLQGRAALRHRDVELAIADGVAERLGLADGDEATIVVRPERMELQSAGDRVSASPDSNILSGTVAETVYLGVARKVVVDLDVGGSATVRLEGDGRVRQSPANGVQVTVEWAPAAAVVVPGRPGDEKGRG